jgi:glycosyltransferase involved in cell wall biosynthesis
LKSIFHFAQDDDTSGFFPQLGRWYDRGRYRMYFGTLKPMASWLREYMESQGVRCFACNCRSRADYPLGLLKLARFLRQEQIDVLHTHLFDPSIVGLHAGVLAGTRVRVLTRHYSDYHTRINKKWHVRLDQFSTRLSHAAIAVSQHTADHMIEVEKAPPSKIQVVLNGIDFDRVRPSAEGAPERMRRQFGAEDSYLLLIVARLHPEKGHRYLFEALPDIVRRLGQPVRLLVAGAGRFEAAYRETVRSLGLKDMVSFLGFRRDAADLMAAADLLVLPSLAEAFGLVLTEAIYLGTPVVATRVGGIPEIVEDGRDGVLVPPADSRALALAITNLLADPARRKAMSGAGRDRIIARFGFKDMVGSYQTIYQKLLGETEDNASAHSLSGYSNI